MKTKAKNMTEKNKKEDQVPTTQIVNAMLSPVLHKYMPLCIDITVSRITAPKTVIFRLKIEGRENEIKNATKKALGKYAHEWVIKFE